MPDDLNDICRICGGDKNIAKIANRMGFRPDIAFAEINKLKVLLAECHQKFIDYEMDTDCDIPYVHRDFMNRIKAAIKD